MNISEKELEDWIFNADSETLAQIGLEEFSNCKRFRQVTIGDYGRADIITVSKSYNEFVQKTYPMLDINIYELKINPVTSEDIDQVLRYSTAVSELFNNRAIAPSVNMQCYLIAPSITSGHYILNHSDVVFITYEFDIAGFKFTEHKNDWCKGNGALTYNDIKL